YGQLAGARRHQERAQESSALSSLRRCPTFGRNPFPGTADELPSCRLRGLNELANVPIGILEDLPQHVRGPFGGGERLDQNDEPGLQGFTLFGFKFRANATVGMARMLRVERRLVTRTSRLDGIDREPRCSGRKKCARGLHRTAVARLPANPDLLD